MRRKLILASSSAGRFDVLSRTNYPFEVRVSDYEEDMSLPMPPAKLAIYLSRGKGQDVAQYYKSKDVVILAADSFAVFGKELLGKPHTKKRAHEMLAMLSGHKHSFVTGFTIIDARTGRMVSDSVKTDVYFRKYTDQEIKAYLRQADVLQKAGAYTVQGLGGNFIKRIDGDYTNIVGLPLGPVMLALRPFGIDLLAG